MACGTRNVSEGSMYTRRSSGVSTCRSWAYTGAAVARMLATASVRKSRMSTGAAVGGGREAQSILLPAGERCPEFAAVQRRDEPGILNGREERRVVQRRGELGVRHR